MLAPGDIKSLVESLCQWQADKKLLPGLEHKNGKRECSRESCRASKVESKLDFKKGNSVDF